MHEKHKGHESMHAEMVIILLITLVVAQIALVEWKKRHYKSYSVSSFCFSSIPIFCLTLSPLPTTLQGVHAHRPVDHSPGHLHQEPVHPLYRPLGDILHPDGLCDAPRHGQTSARHDAAPCLQVLLLYL